MDCWSIVKMQCHASYRRWNVIHTIYQHGHWWVMNTSSWRMHQVLLHAIGASFSHHHQTTVRGMASAHCMNCLDCDHLHHITIKVHTSCDLTTLACWTLWHNAWRLKVCVGSVDGRHGNTGKVPEAISYYEKAYECGDSECISSSKLVKLYKEKEKQATHYRAILARCDATGVWMTSWIWWQVVNHPMMLFKHYNS